MPLSADIIFHAKLSDFSLNYISPGPECKGYSCAAGSKVRIGSYQQSAVSFQPGHLLTRLRQGRLNVPFFKRVSCNHRIFIDKKYKSPILTQGVGSIRRGILSGPFHFEGDGGGRLSLARQEPLTFSIGA
jgi:hypothetical protein